MEVTVRDNGNGTLDTSSVVITQVQSDIGAETSTGVEEAVFNNEYTASGSLTLAATKTLQGQSLADGQFTFTLTDVTEGLDETDRLQTQTVKNNGSAVAFYVENLYDQDDVGKTFTYEIRETAGEAGKGYTYSDAVYRATVEVSLDEAANKIETAVTYTRYNAETQKWDEVTAQEVVFANAYKAHGETTISGTKTVTYRDADVTKGEFSFLLKEGDNEIATIQTDRCRWKLLLYFQL